MNVFDLLAYGFNGVSQLLSYPVLMGFSILDIGIAMTSVIMIERFLLKPMFGRHSTRSIKGDNEESANNLQYSRQSSKKAASDRERWNKSDKSQRG